MDKDANDIELHEMIFAHQIGVDGEERFVVPLLHLAKQLLYMLPDGWEMEFSENELGKLPFFYNTETDESDWIHPDEEKCKQTIINKRKELEEAVPLVSETDNENDFQKSNVSSKMSNALRRSREMKKRIYESAENQASLGKSQKEKDRQLAQQLVKQSENNSTIATSPPPSLEKQHADLLLKKQLSQQIQQQINLNVVASTAAKPAPAPAPALAPSRKQISHSGFDDLFVEPDDDELDKILAQRTPPKQNAAAAASLPVPAPVPAPAPVKKQLSHSGFDDLFVEPDDDELDKILSHKTPPKDAAAIAAEVSVDIIGNQQKQKKRDSIRKSIHEVSSFSFDAAEEEQSTTTAVTADPIKAAMSSAVAAVNGGPIVSAQPGSNSTALEQLQQQLQKQQIEQLAQQQLLVQQEQQQAQQMQLMQQFFVSHGLQPPTPLEMGLAPLQAQQQQQALLQLQLQQQQQLAAKGINNSGNLFGGELPAQNMQVFPAAPNGWDENIAAATLTKALLQQGQEQQLKPNNNTRTPEEPIEQPGIGTSNKTSIKNAVGQNGSIGSTEGVIAVESSHMFPSNRTGWADTPSVVGSQSPITSAALAAVVPQVQSKQPQQQQQQQREQTSKSDAIAGEDTNWLLNQIERVVTPKPIGVQEVDSNANSDNQNSNSDTGAAAAPKPVIEEQRNVATVRVALTPLEAVQAALELEIPGSTNVDTAAATDADGLIVEDQDVSEHLSPCPPPAPSDSSAAMLKQLLDSLGLTIQDTTQQQPQQQPQMSPTGRRKDKINNNTNIMNSSGVSNTASPLISLFSAAGITKADKVFFDCSVEADRVYNKEIIGHRGAYYDQVLTWESVLSLENVRSCDVKRKAEEKQKKKAVAAAAAAAAAEQGQHVKTTVSTSPVIASNTTTNAPSPAAVATTTVAKESSAPSYSLPQQEASGNDTSSKAQYSDDVAKIVAEHQPAFVIRTASDDGYYYSDDGGSERVINKPAAAAVARKKDISPRGYGYGAVLRLNGAAAAVSVSDIDVDAAAPRKVGVRSPITTNESSDSSSRKRFSDESLLRSNSGDKNTLNHHHQQIKTGARKVTGGGGGAHMDGINTDDPLERLLQHPSPVLAHAGLYQAALAQAGKNAAQSPHQMQQNQQEKEDLSALYNHLFQPTLSKVPKAAAAVHHSSGPSSNTKGSNSARDAAAGKSLNSKRSVHSLSPMNHDDADKNWVAVGVFDSHKACNHSLHRYQQTIAQHLSQQHRHDDGGGDDASTNQRQEQLLMQAGDKLRIRRDLARMQWVVECNDSKFCKILQRTQQQRQQQQHHNRRKQQQQQHQQQQQGRQHGDYDDVSSDAEDYSSFRSPAVALSRQRQVPSFSNPHINYNSPLDDLYSVDDASSAEKRFPHKQRSHGDDWHSHGSPSSGHGYSPSHPDNLQSISGDSDRMHDKPNKAKGKKSGSRAGGKKGVQPFMRNRDIESVVNMRKIADRIPPIPRIEDVRAAGAGGSKGKGGSGRNSKHNFGGNAGAGAGGHISIGSAAKAAAGNGAGKLPMLNKPQQQQKARKQKKPSRGDNNPYW